MNAIPSLSLEERYDSNVFNTAADEKSDYVFRAIPKLTLSIAAFSASVNLSGGFELERYAKHHELDSGTATKNYELAAAEPLRITPRFSIHPSARFVETRDAVRRNALTQSPEPGLPPSETVVTTRTGVRDISGSLQLVYLLLPAVDLEIGGGGAKREFTEGAPGLIGSRTVTGNASVIYRITPRFSTGFFVDTSYNSFDGMPNSRTYSGGLSGSYVLTEHYTVDAHAGAALSRESTGIGDQKTDTWSPIGRLSLTYAWKDFQAKLLGSYELAGRGSFGRTTKRGNAVLTLTDRFAERWWWDLSGYYQTNRSTDEQVTEDLATAEGTGGIRYAVAEWVSVRLSGSIFRQWSHGPVGTNLERDSVLLGLTLSNIYPVF
ncbi:DUF481 domain-containing protein [Candidatus Poribacteria bacterium]|nr:DUF481 domain-containing protein [Candidatus Poribacteria bacterium]